MFFIAWTEAVKFSLIVRDERVDRLVATEEEEGLLDLDQLKDVQACLTVKVGSRFPAGSGTGHIMDTGRRVIVCYEGCPLLCLAFWARRC